MKFNYKKVASVLASAAMVGSTMGFAFAATYPAPFVSGGSSDVAIVVGSSTSADDMIAATDIGANLGAKVTTGSVTGAAPTGGDSVLVAKTSNNINLFDTLSGVYGATVDSDDLNTLLADGTYTDDLNSEFKYEQKLTLGGVLQLVHFSDSDYKDSKPTVGINISSSGSILNYTLDFTTDPYFEPYTYIETTTLPILGKSYYVLDAVNTSSTDHKLTLLDTANTGIVAEGESVVIGGKTVSIVFISSTQVKLKIGEDTTNLLAAGGTYKLSDGTYVGVKEIMSKDVAGSVGQIEISLGSGKLEIQNSQDVKLNDNTISDITGYITTSSGSKLSKVILEWKVDDDKFLTTESELTMPGFNAVKLSFPELVLPEEEVTTVEPGADDYMQIKTTIKDGEVTIPILYATTGTGYFKGVGKDSTHILYTSNETTTLVYNKTANHDMMVLSWNSSTESESYLVKFAFTNANGINSTDAFKKVDSEWQGTPVCDDKKPGDTCDIGSLTITFNDVQAAGTEKSANFNLSAGSSANLLYTKGGLKVWLPWNSNSSFTAPGDAGTGHGFFNLSSDAAGHNNNTFILTFKEEDKDDGVAKGTEFNVTIDDTSTHKLEVSTISAQAANINEIETTTTTDAWVPSDLATKVRRIGDSSSARKAEITYHNDEVYAKIYISAPATTFGTGAGTITPVYDNQLSSVNTKNLVVVGGSCVNTVAATLLGSSTALCGADWTTKVSASAGEYVIRTYKNTAVTSKLATLVAGWAKEDTANAAKALTTSTTIEIADGKNYKGTTASDAAAVV